MSGIAAVQARIAEIQTQIQAVAYPRPAVTGTTATAFADTLSAAVATEQAASVLGGTTGGSLTGVAGTGSLAGMLGAAGVTGTGTAQPGTGAALVDAAKKYLGVPYVWGGESLAEGGLDCSGLVQLAFKDMGISVPRVAREQMHLGTEVPTLAQALPGDLIVTRGGGHIGIYLGDNKLLHAPRPGEQVEIREMFETDATIDTIRRLLPTGPAQTAAGTVDVSRLAIELAAGGL